jgi:hypothetical protein
MLCNIHPCLESVVVSHSSPRLGIPIFGYDFWDPHRKRNSGSISDSEDSGRKNFNENSAVEKSRNQNSDSEIRNSKKNQRRNLILLISRMMSIVIGQSVGLRMSNHMDEVFPAKPVGLRMSNRMDEIMPGKGNLTCRCYPFGGSLLKPGNLYFRPTTNQRPVAEELKYSRNRARRH